MTKAPHPIPYQGSKRNIAMDILFYFPKRIATLYEPFAGSAAISLASASLGLADKYRLNDICKPLADLWTMIIESPEKIAKQYELIWRQQLENPRQFYDKIRCEFNLTGRADYFLYLLARCVKASVRFNSSGEFNQSPDNRRLGMRPETMRDMIIGASYLLKGKTRISSKSCAHVLQNVKQNDLIYMDPPYQGVCQNRDSRYAAGVQFRDFVELLKQLNNKSIKYIVSYDGRTGDKIHGQSLPFNLDLTHIEIHAGRSSQSTLLGRKDITIESLYLSPALKEDLDALPSAHYYTEKKQLSLFEKSI